MDTWFLPSWPITLNNFAVFGLVLWAGLMGGALAHRTGFLPRITGFILIGFLLGPSMLNLLDQEMISGAEVFVDIALGLIMFQLGEQVHIPSLRRDTPVLATGLLESATTFVLVYMLLVSLGIESLHAALVAAIGISSSPAVVLLVMREFEAAGPVSERVLDLVALNNILAFFVFSGLLPFLHREQEVGWLTAALHPVYQAAGSLVLAWVLAHVTIRLARAVGQGENVQFALLVGVVVMGVGLARMLEVSLVLTLLTLGVLCRNLDHRRDLLEVEFGHGGEIFFVILFVISGANLHVAELATVGWAAVGFVAARFVGKGLVVFAASRLTGLSSAQAGGLSLALVPMAGMAIGLVQTTAGLYPAFAGKLSAIVLGAVVILETIGPIATVFGLKMAGEVKASRAIDH